MEATGRVAMMDFSRVIRDRSDLHIFQSEEAIPFLRRNPKSGLFADLGLGKAVMLATTLVDEWDLDTQGLVIAPVRVAKQTWPTEFAEWGHLAGFPLTLIRAEDDTPEVHAVYRRKYEQFYVQMKMLHHNAREAARFAQICANQYRDRAKKILRRKLAMKPTPLHIIGIEQTEWLVRFWGSRWPYRNVVLDESSKFKEYSTTRFRALNSVYDYIHRMHIATASPAAESYMGLFAQVYLLDRGARLGRNITAYRNRFFTYNPYNRTYKIKPGAQEEISGLIADICLVMKAEDYLPMEKPNYLRRYIELDEPTRKMKDEFEQNYVLKFDSGTVIEAINGAALSNKLLQFSSGAVYDEEKRIHPIHDEKIEDLKQLVDELDGEPIMVAYWFQSSLQRLKKSFPKATVMDKGGKCVDAWNAGKIEMLLIHPASAGHGLNMQKGPGHDLYFFDIPWSRELYEQIIGRLARQGQKRIVRVYHALVRDTLDEIVLQALNDKGAGQEALFRYIKRIRDRMRRKA
jgi:hypothetical protein